MSNFSLHNLNFKLPSVSGEEISLANYSQSSAIIIIFTCNHCPYAIAYEERLIKLAKTYSPKGIPLIAISSNDAKQYPQDSFERMKERAAEKGFNFPYLYDESQEVAKSFGAKRTPHAFILKAESEDMWQILYSGAIDDNYKNEQFVKKSYLSNSLDQLLAQGKLAPWHTESIGCTIKWKM
ncbi:MAG: thioredoxin family protein [Bacteroidia bacterium]|nr:thioredoxin family protein [Bacteroidia bacterium]